MTRATPKTTAGTASKDKVSDASLQRHAGYHMKRAFNVVQADLNATLKPFGLRMVTYSALVIIVDNPGLRQAQLADAIQIERPNLVVILDELEEAGLISRDRVPTDRRAYALVATLAGQKLCKQALEAVDAHERRVYAGWDQETRNTVIGAMKQIRHHQEEG